MMLKYDYVLERILSDNRSLNFVPKDIPKTLPDMVLIEGPNSSGKSTLLNIIALGLFGRNNGRIDPNLKIKMNSLLNPKYNKLTFSFEIQSKSGALLRAMKRNADRGEITVEEAEDGQNFKPLSPERFERKYNLIYDIPNNPTARLPELLRELKDEQQHFGMEVKNLSQLLDEIMTDISKSRDKKKLEETKRNLSELSKQEVDLNERIQEKEATLDLMEKTVYLNFYLRYLNDCERLSKRVEELESKLRDFRDSGERNSSTMLKQKRKIAKVQEDFASCFTQVGHLIEGALSKKERERYQIWKEINPYTTEDNDLYTVYTEIVYYRALFEQQMSDMEKNDDFKNAAILKRILESLRAFAGSAIEIPQINVTIGQLVDILEQQNRKTIDITGKYENLGRILNLLEELDRHRRSLCAGLEELRKWEKESRSRAESADDYVELRSHLTNTKRELQDFTQKRDHYFSKCISKGFNKYSLENSGRELLDKLMADGVAKGYLTFTEESAVKEIEGLDSDIHNMRNNLSNLKYLIPRLSKDVEQLEKLKPHKYEQHLDSLKELYQQTLVLSQNILRDYNAYLKDLIDISTNAKEVTSNEGLINDAYANEVYRYLASRIGTFRHINSTYTAKEVNIISKTIVTEEGYTIPMGAMGTGESMSAYLLGLLNVPTTDERKIIALFDEIAMMDDVSLEPVCLKLKQLFNENRLILAILVQKKSKETSVRAI